MNYKNQEKSGSTLAKWMGNWCRSCIPTGLAGSDFLSWPNPLIICLLFAGTPFFPPHVDPHKDDRPFLPDSQRTLHKAGEPRSWANGWGQGLQYKASKDIHEN